MDRNVVVTGAASGIGAATAGRLQNEGWTVIGLDVAYDQGEQTNPGDAACGVCPVHCDVASAQSIENAFAIVAEKFGHLDAVVCSAGKLAAAPLVDMTVEAFDQIYHVNTRGAWLSARNAVPLMRKSPNRELLPRIVFLGSVSGLRPKIASGAYAAQKAALHTLTGVLAAELAPEGILVNAVAPGTVDTPMIRAMADQAASGKYRPSGKSPLGRIAEPHDVAAVIAFLLGEQSSYVTGSVIPVDGGTRAAFVPQS